MESIPPRILGPEQPGPLQVKGIKTYTESGFLSKIGICLGRLFGLIRKSDALSLQFGIPVYVNRGSLDRFIREHRAQNLDSGEKREAFWTKLIERGIGTKASSLRYSVTNVTIRACAQATGSLFTRHASPPPTTPEQFRDWFKRYPHFTPDNKLVMEQVYQKVFVSDRATFGDRFDLGVAKQNFLRWFEEASVKGHFPNTSVEVMESILANMHEGEMERAQLEVKKQQIGTWATRDGVVAFYRGGPTSFLGNFALCPRGITLPFQGQMYQFRCAEAAFQWKKFVLAAQHNGRTDLLHDPRLSQFYSCDGEGAFQLRTALDSAYPGVYVPNWLTGGRDTVMWEVLQAKFQQNPEMRELLEATHPALLLEHNERPGRDQYWSDNYDGRGENMLGRMLMTLRDGSSTLVPSMHQAVVRRDFLVRVERWIFSHIQPQDNVPLVRELSSEGSAPSPTLSQREKEQLLSDVQQLGLKLPKGHGGVPLTADRIVDRKQFLLSLALRNGYADIPEENLMRCSPKLQQIGREYNALALDLRTRWLTQNPTLERIVKVTKKGLRQIVLYKEEEQLGSGGSKTAHRITLYKPSMPILGTEAVIRAKTKLLAVQVTTYGSAAEEERTRLRIQGEMEREHTITSDLREKGARNIVAVRRVHTLDSKSTVKEVGLLMDYCERGELGTYLEGEGRTLPEREKLGLAVEVASALQDMHEKGGYRHGDLKKENVFLHVGSDGRPHAFLGDFGYSRREGDEAPAEEGTYVTPEQAASMQRKGTPYHASHATDLWSLGNLLFYLKHGHDIFKESMVRPGIYETPEAFDDFDRAIAEQLDLRDPVDQLIKRLFSRNPDERPEAREVIQILQRRMAELPPSQ